MLRFRPGFCVVLLGLLATATGSAQAQQIPPANQSAFQLPDAPSAVMRVSDIRNDGKIFPAGAALHLGPAEGQRALSMSSLMNYIPDRLVLEQQALLCESIEMPESLGPDDSPVLGARLGWMAFAPSYSQSEPRAVHNLDDWQYYGHHIPVAGPVVLRVGQEAQAHPHVVSVLKVIQPQF